MANPTDKLRTAGRELRWLWRDWRRMGRRDRWATIREWLLEDGARQGLGGPPNNWQGSPEIAGPDGIAYTAMFLDDATSVGIAVKWPEDGGASRWKLMLPPAVLRRLALWYLWRWAYGEWFGLRRALYYRWLRRHVARMPARRR